MLPILLMEPDATGKRRHFSDTLLGPRKSSTPSVEEVKDRLREVRYYSLDHLEELVDELTASLTQNPGVEVTFAQDAVQAVKTIKEISESKKIAISKSMVVAEELKPALLQSGFTIIETYFDQFESFENKLDQLSRLPKIDFETTYYAFDRTSSLISRRKANINKQGLRNFTGVLGINAISAREGAVLLLQHTHNISDVVEQANELVLIAGLDKIVRDLEDALFNTKCMGVFGWEIIPNKVTGKTNKEATIYDLPFDVHPEKALGKIHLIILDNGRKELLKGQYKKLLACIGCRACIKSCPGSSFFTDDGRWTPRDYINYYLFGKHQALDQCLQCKSCKAECPLDLDLPGMILDAKTQAAKSLSPTDLFLSNYPVMAKTGSYASEISNAVTQNRLTRLVLEKVFGISKERELPKIQRMTFTKWFMERFGSRH